MINLVRNLSVFKKNPFIGMALAGLVINVFSEYISKVLNWTRSYFTNKCFVVLTIGDNIEAYDWINYWFYTSKYCDKVNNLSVGILYEREKDDEGRNKTHVMLTPGTGTHLIKYENVYFFLSKSNKEDSKDIRGNPDTTSPLSAKRIFSVEKNMITLKCFYKDKEKLLQFIEQAGVLYYSIGKKQSTLYQCKYGEWYRKNFLMPRTIDSLILEDDVLEDLIKDIQWFLENKNYYRERSIPYRRGFLLYGPPGTGKTSTILALANYFGIDVYYMDIGSPFFDDSHFVSAIAAVPHNAFLVIEDVDTVSTVRKEGDDKGPQVNKGTILNSIDGLFASEGRVLFMTTNNREKIYDALLRPGRCDKQIYFGYMSDDQIRRMVRRFFPDVTDVILDEILCKCTGHELSPAFIQELEN